MASIPIRSILAGLALAGLLYLPCSARPVRVDPARSRVEVDAKATVGVFVARVQKFEAIVTVAPSGDRVESVQFRADFAAIKTGSAGRDTDMNEWVHAAQYPKVTFLMTGLEAAGAGGFTVHGRLTLHGVERAIDFPAQISFESGQFVADGAVTLDTRDYGLPVIKKLLVLKVDPLVKVHFHLQGSL